MGHPLRESSVGLYERLAETGIKYIPPASMFEDWRPGDDEILDGDTSAAILH